MAIDRRAVTFGFLNAGHFLDHLLMLLFPTVVLALGAEFADSYGDLLWLSVLGFVAFGGGALPAGWLADRWGRRHMLIVFFVGTGAAAVLTGLATGPFSLGAGLFAIGLFASIYHPVGIAMVGETTERIGRAMGINGVFGNLGVASAALTAGALIDYASWRWAFFVPGAVAMATGLAYAVWTRPVAGQGAQPAMAAVHAATQFDMRRLWIVLIVATACGGVVFNGVTIALPKLFDERLAELVSSPAQIGALVSLVVTAAAFAQIAVGYLIDRFPIRPVYVSLSLLTIPTMAAAVHGTGVPLLATAVVMMMLIFGQIPILDTVVARHVPAAWRSRAYAVKYVVSLGVGATAVPLVAELYKLNGSFVAVLSVMSALAVAVAAAACWLPAFRKVSATA